MKHLIARDCRSLSSTVVLRSMILIPFLLAMVDSAVAQNTVTVRNMGNVTRADAVSDGSTVTVDWDFSDRNAGTSQAALSDLDISSPTLDKDLAEGANDHPYVMRLECRDSRECVHGSIDRLNRIPVDSVLGPFTTDTQYLYCESAAKCVAFLQALRGGA
jgi:hypothetical protein